MSKSNIVHDTLVIERSYPVPPARVFAAFADVETKRRWFTVDKEQAATAVTVAYENDFRVGGKETNRIRWSVDSPGGSPAGTVMGTDSIYLDIVENDRIVFASSMLVGDSRISSSLATIQFVPEGQGTRVVCTEQVVFYDDKSPAIKLRKHGWTHILDKLAKAIA
jgi:uncharacterized protein YndB with AHSA1/START domain